MLTPAAIERRLRAFVKAHIETYLRAQEAQEATEDPARAEVFPLIVPETIVRLNPETRFAEDQLPAIVVDVPTPIRGKRGRSRATWDADVLAQIGVLTSAADGADARDNAGTYIAALRWLFTTQQTVDGLADGVDYVDDGLTDPFSVGQSRYMAAGELDVTILIRGIADRVTLPNASGSIAVTEPINIQIAARVPTEVP